MHASEANVFVSQTVTASSAAMMGAVARAAVASARTLASTISASVSPIATESSAAAMDAERIAGFVVRELSAKKASVRQLAQSRFAHLYPLAAWVLWTMQRPATHSVLPTTSTFIALRWGLGSVLNGK